MMLERHIQHSRQTGFLTYETGTKRDTPDVSSTVTLAVVTQVSYDDKTFYSSLYFRAVTLAFRDANLTQSDGVLQHSCSAY